MTDTGNSDSDQPALHNPSGLDRLTDVQMCEEVVRLSKTPMGPYLRLLPARFQHSCGKDQLRPALGGWTGDELVTHDPERVAELWDKYRGYSVATRCDDLFVFDIDLLPSPDRARSRENPWLESLPPEARQALDAGLKAITPSGGTHIYFRRPAGALTLRIAAKIGWADGVDLLTGSGKLVMMPPSFAERIEKGYCGRYQWADCEKELSLVELPDVLCNLISPASPPELGGTQADPPAIATGARDGRIPCGKRHDYLRNRARYLRGQGLEEHELIAALLAEARTTCSSSPTPIPDDEVIELAVSAARKFGPDRPRSNTRLVIMTATEFKAIPPPRFVIDRVIPAGLTIAFSKPGIGKSFFCLAVGSAVARGVPLFGNDEFAINSPGQVLFALPEGAPSWAERLRAFDAYHGYADSPDMSFIRYGVNLFDSQAWAQLVAAIDGLTHVNHMPPALVIIDTLAAATPGANENAIEDMGLVMGRLQELVSRGSNVLLSHHSNRAGDYRGHSAIAASCDAMLHLATAPFSSVIEITSTKLRDAQSIAPCSFEIRATDFGPVPIATESIGPWAQFLIACGAEQGLLDSLLAHGLRVPDGTPSASECTDFSKGVTLRQILATWNQLCPPRDRAHRGRRQRAAVKIIRALTTVAVLRIRKGTLSGNEPNAMEALIYQPEAP